MLEIEINLLDWRSKYLQLKNRYWLVVFVFFNLIFLFCSLIAMIFTNKQINKEESNISYLEQEIANLSRQAILSNRLKQELDAITERYQRLAAIGHNKFLWLQVLTDLAQLDLKGLVLHKIHTSEQGLELWGSTSSSLILSKYLKSIKALTWVDSYNLKQIKDSFGGSYASNLGSGSKADLSTNSTNNFQLTINIKTQYLAKPKSSSNDEAKIQ